MSERPVPVVLCSAGPVRVAICAQHILSVRAPTSGTPHLSDVLALPTNEFAESVEVLVAAGENVGAVQVDGPFAFEQLSPGDLWRTPPALPGDLIPAVVAMVRVPDGEGGHGVGLVLDAHHLAAML